MSSPRPRQPDAGADDGAHARGAAYRRHGARPAAWRLTLLWAGAALAAVATVVTALTLALHQPVTVGLLDFGIFGGLAAVTAGVLAWELAGNRYCPRCGGENARGTAACAGCGYDLETRPRFACSEGHRLVYEPGMCDCGRRLLAVRAPEVGRHAMNVIVLAFAAFVAVLLLAWLLAWAT